MVCWNFCQIIILSKSLIVLNPNRIFSQKINLRSISCMLVRQKCGGGGAAYNKLLLHARSQLKADRANQETELWRRYENTKNASSLGLFLADRTRGASKIPRVIFHVADGHLDSIFQSTARHTLLRKALVSLLDVK